MEREPNIDIRREGALYALLPTFKRRWTQAVDYAAQAFSVCVRPYLALSAGKDSVAMLAVVDAAARRCGRDFDLWIHVSDASFPGTRETAEACAAKVGRRLIIDESPVSAFDVVGKQSSRQFGKTGYFFDAISQALDVYDLCFVGVRADESKRRRNACRAHGPIFKTTVPRPHTKCQPICWFTIWDVAAAIVSTGMPLHPIYDKHPCSTACIRLGYVTALDLIDKGTVSFLRHNYPAQFARLCSVYPRARLMT